MVSNLGLRKAVFFDRDGVLNRSLVVDGRPFAPVRLEDFEIFPQAILALKRTQEAGFINIVVTNQPDLQTGRQSKVILDKMHARLSDALPISDILVCPHIESDFCNCRKPSPGMLFEAANRHGIILENSWMVGDRWRDIQAGQAAKCRCCFIDYGYKEKKPTGDFLLVHDVNEAVDFILANRD